MKTKLYALREHFGDNCKIDSIVIRDQDEVIYIKIPAEKLREALKEFETGEEININY